MRKFLGLLAALPLWLTASGLSGDWAFYEAPFATWDETDVAAITGTPEKHGKASRQSVRLADGVFVRETAKGKTSLLVHRFEAPSDGTLFLRCGANCLPLRRFMTETHTAFSQEISGNWKIFNLKYSRSRKP